MSNPKLKRDTTLEAGEGVPPPVFRKPDFIGTESVPVPTFGAHDSIAAGWATVQPLNVHDYLNKDKYDKLPIHERPVIGFDCEYTYELKTNSNQVLSYQWCVYHKGIAHSGIHYVKNGKRLKFKKLISIAFESAKEAGVLTGSEEQFLLGAHFSRADISLLEDFFEGLFKDLSVLRKTFLSFEEKPYDIDLESFTKSMFKSQKLNYWDQSRNKKTVHIQFMDTMTLSPGGRSLADLGDFLGVKKA